MQELGVNSNSESHAYRKNRKPILSTIDLNDSIQFQNNNLNSEINNKIKKHNGSYRMINL